MINVIDAFHDFEEGFKNNLESSIEDKIAELDWHPHEKLEQLIAYELCHIIHFNMIDNVNIIDTYNDNYKYGKFA